jgi:hypothetical protein
MHETKTHPDRFGAGGFDSNDRYNINASLFCNVSLPLNICPYDLLSSIEIQPWIINA